MLYCPNPSCTQNLRTRKKSFPSEKSSSNHVQSSECKAFVLSKQTVISAPTMQAPMKQVTIESTTQLFKKQWLRLNPTISTQQQYTDNSIEDDAMDDVDDNIFLFDDNATQPDSMSNNNSVSSEECFDYEDFVDNNDFAKPSLKMAKMLRINALATTDWLVAQVFLPLAVQAIESGLQP